MCFGRDLFDLNGDGEMDMMEEYFAYRVITDDEDEDEDDYKNEEDHDEEEW